jgi:2',3'-cyclic-nucleotide 2'-phosphodiesterase/3'-nucleotidase
VGGNIYFEDTEHPFLPPYIIVEREGVKVAFMGLTTPALTDWLPRNLWTGLEFKDMETAAKRWMDYLHQHEKPELVIGVFHSGYDGGIVTEEYAENAAKSVAINVPGFDAIFFGHIHQPHVASVVNVEGDTVLLVNPANNACKVAALDVAVNRSGEPRVTLAAELVDMDAYEPDTAYMRHFVPHMERVRKYVAKKIGESTHEVYSRDAYFGPSDYVDFVHRMQLDITKAQVSLAAPLAYDSSLSGGDLHVRDMFEFYRYENMLYVMHLKGQEIKDYLEMSYGQWTNQMKRADDHLLLFDEETLTSATPRLKNLYYNFDSAAGIIYEVDVTKPVGERIRIKSMADGKPFSLEAMYRVAVNSYRGNGGGELLTKGAGIPREELEERVISSTDIDLRFYMLNYIEMRQNIDPQRLNHWKFVPDHWANVAAKRDYKLLFGR